jgi:hypothetical protein
MVSSSSVSTFSPVGSPSLLSGSSGLSSSTSLSMAGTPYRRCWSSTDNLIARSNWACSSSASTFGPVESPNPSSPKSDPKPFRAGENNDRIESIGSNDIGSKDALRKNLSSVPVVLLGVDELPRLGTVFCLPLERVRAAYTEPSALVIELCAIEPDLALVGSSCSLLLPLLRSGSPLNPIIRAPSKAVGATVSLGTG